MTTDGDNGMPTNAYKFATIPQNITLDDVNKGTSVMSVAQMKTDYIYDGGQRVWSRVLGAGMDFEMLDVPGVGSVLQDGKELRQNQIK